jgi:hypothetical protein
VGTREVGVCARARNWRAACHVPSGGFSCLCGVTAKAVSPDGVDSIVAANADVETKLNGSGVDTRVTSPWAKAFNQDLVGHTHPFTLSM